MVIMVIPAGLNDWISRFKWNPMEAASEVENVLQVWERRLDRRAQLLHRRGNRQKGTFLKPQSFWQKVSFDFSVKFLGW
jgi:hypothetical protein